jgi:hypothetical protein
MNLRPLITSILTIPLLSTVTGAEDPVTAGGDSAKEETIRIVSFSIIDTRTQEPVEGYAKITKNDTISISKLPTDKINVRANVSGRPGSVRFIVPEKKVNRVESKAPYSLAGDIYGRFLKWTATPGDYTLAAVPYTESDARGDRGRWLKVKVRFTE